jgi:hypothetical protein
MMIVKNVEAIGHGNYIYTLFQKFSEENEENNENSQL